VALPRLGGGDRTDGRFIQGWGGRLAMSEAMRESFDWPVQEHGIAVDNKGNVWVCGNGRDAKTGRDDDQCIKFTTTEIPDADRALRQKQGQPGYGKSRPSLAAGLLAKANELFVSDVMSIGASMSPMRYRKVQAHVGRLCKAPDDNAPRDRKYDPVPQQFNLLHGMTIAKDGTVYVPTATATGCSHLPMRENSSRKPGSRRERRRAILAPLWRGAVRRQGATLPLCRRRP